MKIARARARVVTEHLCRVFREAGSLIRLHEFVNVSAY